MLGLALVLTVLFMIMCRSLIYVYAGPKPKVALASEVGKGKIEQQRDLRTIPSRTQRYGIFDEGNHNSETFDFSMVEKRRNRSENSILAEEDKEYWDNKFSHTPLVKNCCDHYKFCLHKNETAQPSFPTNCRKPCTGIHGKKFSIFALRHKQLKDFCRRHDKYVMPCVQEKLGLKRINRLFLYKVLERCHMEMTDENSTGDERDVIERVFRIYKYLCKYYYHSVLENEECFKFKTENCVLKHIPELCQAPCYYQQPSPLLQLEASNNSWTTKQDDIPDDVSSGLLVVFPSKTLTLVFVVGQLWQYLFLKIK